MEESSNQRGSSLTPRLVVDGKRSPKGLLVTSVGVFTLVLKEERFLVSHSGPISSGVTLHSSCETDRGPGL